MWNQIISYELKKVRGKTTSCAAGEEGRESVSRDGKKGKLSEENGEKTE